MTIPDFTDIERMHAEWSKTDKAAKIAWLIKERMRLNGLANQMAQHVSANGGFMNEAERAEARLLLDMIQSVDAEGRKVFGDIQNDAFKEIVKELIKM